MGDFILRLKYEIVENGYLIAGGVAVLALFCVIVLFTGALIPSLQAATMDGQDTDRIPEQTHEVTTISEHSTAILEDSEAYSEGEELTNERFYPLSNTQQITYDVDVGEANTNVESVDIFIVYEASERSDGDPFWSNERHLSGGESSGTVSTVLDIHDVQDRTANLEEEFGRDVFVTVYLETQIEYTYENAVGDETSDRVMVTDEVEFTERLYSVETTSHTERVTTGSPPVQPEGLSVIHTLFILLGLLSVIGSVLIAIGHREYDKDKIAEEISEARFNEWVTEVDRFTPPGDMMTVSTQSLSDLVDLAIDTRNRVIHDKTTGEYVVFDEDIIYLYHPDVKDSADASAMMFGMFGEKREQSLPEPSMNWPNTNSRDDGSIPNNGVFGGKRGSNENEETEE